MGAGIAGHGLTVREQQIMDRIDAGAKPRAVAAELGIKEDYVRAVATFYNGSWSHNNAFERMVVAGTKALASAIDLTGGRFA